MLLRTQTQALRALMFGELRNRQPDDAQARKAIEIANTNAPDDYDVAVAVAVAYIGPALADQNRDATRQAAADSCRPPREGRTLTAADHQSEAAMREDGKKLADRNEIIA